MADEVQLQFVKPGWPAQVLAAWKADPPDAFSQRGFKLKDEAYDSLVYEEWYYDWPAKLLFVTTFGFALLFKGFMGSSFQLTVRFDDEGSTRTKVTIIGRAHPRTRRRLTELASENGGAVGLRVGV
jgi:hypothetical protein